MPAADSLKGVEAYIFDVFGTVVDWYGNITKVLAEAAPEGVQEGMKHCILGLPSAHIGWVRLGRIRERVADGVLQPCVSAIEEAL